MNNPLFAAVALVLLFGAAFAFTGTQYVRTIQNIPQITPTIYLPSKTLINNSSQAAGSAWETIEGGEPNVETAETTAGSEKSPESPGGRNSIQELESLFGTGLSGIKDAAYDKNGNHVPFKYQDKDGVWHQVTDIKYGEQGRLTSYEEKGGDGGTKKRDGIKYNERGQIDSYHESGTDNNGEFYTYTRKNIGYDDLGRMSGYEEEGVNDSNKKTASRSNIKYDQYGQVVSYTEVTTNSESPNKRTSTVHNIEYNELGQVEKETVIHKETGNKTDAGKLKGLVGAKTTEELVEFGKKLEKANPAIEGVKVGNNSSIISHKRRGTFLGFIPVDYVMDIEVDENGVKGIQKPWWSFMLGDDTRDLEDRLRQTNDELSSGSEISKVQLQDLMSRRQTAIQLVGNILSEQQNTSMSIIRNMR